LCLHLYPGLNSIISKPCRQTIDELFGNIQNSILRNQVVMM